MKRPVSQHDNISIRNASFRQFVVLGVVLLACLCFFGEQAIGGVIFLAIGIVLISVSLFIPCRYQFDHNSIAICYLFGRKNKFLKDNIDSIVCKACSDGRSLTWHEYVIAGIPEEEPAFYMNNSIVKNTKNRTCVEMLF